VEFRAQAGAGNLTGFCRPDFKSVGSVRSSEQLTLNQRVQGSSPCAPTKIKILAGGKILLWAGEPRGNLRTYLACAMLGTLRRSTHFRADDAPAKLHRAEGRDPMPPWQPSRDVRRTAKTLMQRAGSDPTFRSGCSRTRSPGVEETYDRYEYLPQKREAAPALSGHARQTYRARPVTAAIDSAGEVIISTRRHSQRRFNLRIERTKFRLATIRHKGFAGRLTAVDLNTHWCAYEAVVVRRSLPRGLFAQGLHGRDSPGGGCAVGSRPADYR
jgi:hypothetical protein